MAACAMLTSAATRVSVTATTSEPTARRVRAQDSGRQWGRNEFIHEQIVDDIMYDLVVSSSSGEHACCCVSTKWRCVVDIRTCSNHDEVYIYYYLPTARIYTITTLTGLTYHARTGDAIYLTMYDSANNSCLERHLNSAGETFENGQ